ncbi:MAG: c-type cytochrome [Hyphomicrobiaceae bacterium]
MRYARTIKIVAGTCFVLALLAVAAIVATVASGIYDVAATRQHPRIVFDTVVMALQRSIAFHARDIPVPDLSRAELATRGLPLYRSHCAACHGEPGRPPRPFAMGMTPVPPPIVAPARELPANELFWVIKHGIKMTGMPAWEMKLSDAEIWSIVAFVKKLPDVSPLAYANAAKVVENGGEFKPSKALGTLGEQPPTGGGHEVAVRVSRASTTDHAHASSAGWKALDPPLHTSFPKELEPCFWLRKDCRTKHGVGTDLGDAARGKLALRAYGCPSCHVIGGIVGRRTSVGPALTRLPHKGYLAGALPNTPGNAVKWITAPQDVNPGSAMPDMGVNTATARDMVAYLYGRSD